LAFLLPLLSVIDPKRSKVQCIILAPSRELVAQIGQVAERLFAGTDIRTVTIIGGANARGQVDRLREERPQIIVASPGRLAELVFRLEKLRLGNVRAVIIDEVDNMMQDSYRGDVEVLLEATAVGKSRARARDGGNQGTSSSSSSSSSTASSAGQGYELEAAEAEALKVVPGIEEEEDEDEEEGAGTGGATQAGEKQKATEDDNASFKGKQFICLASATGTSPSVSAFASRFCREWKKLAVEASSPLPRTITHGLISTPRMRALEQLRKLLAAKPAVQRFVSFLFFSLSLPLILSLARASPHPVSLSLLSSPPQRPHLRQ
jgi:superfamily II DNA/RNA helicase